jgi:hypothetical protein
VNLRIATSIIPVIVFYALTRVAPAWLSISGGFAAATVVFWYNRRVRLISWLTVFGFAVIAVGAVIGIIWNNEKAYLAAGPAQDFLFVPVYLGSIVIRKPLIGGIARELVPAIARRIPTDARVFVYLSLAWAAYDLVHGAIRFYMLQELSVGEYLIWSRIAFWPAGAALVATTAILIMRESRRIAHERGEPAPSLDMLRRPPREPLSVPAASTPE